MGYAAYNMIAKPDIDFQTDYVIRFSSGVIAFSNSAVNFVIYVVQMRGFRIFLKKLVCSARPAVIPEQFDNAAKPGTRPGTTAYCAQVIEMAELEPTHWIYCVYILSEAVDNAQKGLGRDYKSSLSVTIYFPSLIDFPPSLPRLAFPRFNSLTKLSFSLLSTLQFL